MLEDEVKDETPVEEETNEETPAPSEASPEETPEPEPEGEVEEPAAEEQPTRRQSLRIQQLLEKNKQLQQQVETPQTGIDYSKDLEAEPDVLKRISDDIDAKTQAAYNDGLSQSVFRTRLDIDAPKIEAKYPILDKTSTDFHPAVADALNKAYLSAVGYDSETGKAANPNLRYADYIEAQFELADELAGNKVQETSKNIAKQAAQTGLRPDGSQAKRLNLSKAPSEMTEEELVAAIAQSGVQSGRPRK